MAFATPVDLTSKDPISNASHAVGIVRFLAIFSLSKVTPTISSATLRLDEIFKLYRLSIAVYTIKLKSKAIQDDAGKTSQGFSSKTRKILIFLRLGTSLNLVVVLSQY